MVIDLPPPPQHTKLHCLIVEANQLDLRSARIVNKAMEGRSCTVRELDLRQSTSLFAANWVPSKKGYAAGTEEVRVLGACMKVADDGSSTVHVM